MSLLFRTQGLLPRREVVADIPSSFTLTPSPSQTVVDSWGVFTSNMGTPLLITDSVTKRQAVRMDIGSALIAPPGVFDFLSQGPATLLVVWRERNYSPNALLPIFDSSNNGVTNGYQLLARDRPGFSENRQLAARVSNGAGWPIDHTGGPSNSFASLKWNITAAITSPTRGLINVDHATAYDDVLSTILPAGPAGPGVLGNCQIDVMALQAFDFAMTQTDIFGAPDSPELFGAMDLLGSRCSVNMITLIAGDGVRHYGFPSGTRMSNGNRICAYRNGTGHGSSDGSIEAKISSDNKTWGPPQVLATPDVSLGWHDPNVSTISNGDVLMTYEKDDIVTIELIRSSQNGAPSSWSAPMRVSHGYAQLEFCSTQIVEANGFLYMAVYVQGALDPHWSSRVFTSSDLGFTWPGDNPITNGNTDGVDYAEPGILPQGGLNMTALSRVDIDGAMFQSRTSDGGLTWTPNPPVNVIFAVSAARMMQFTSGLNVALLRPTAELAATLFSETAPDVWTTVPTAPGIAAFPRVMDYGQPFEISVGPDGGVADIIFGVQFSANVASVYSRTWDEWQLKGQMPLKPSPASAVAHPGDTIQFTAEGAGNFVWSFDTNASGGTIDASTGFYTRGATHPATDIVRVTDLNGYFKQIFITGS